MPKNPKLDPFVRRYTKVLDEDVKPSYDRAKQWLAQLESTEFWDDRARQIYEARSRNYEDHEERADPDRHPIPSPIHQTKLRLKTVTSAYRKLQKETGKGGFTKRGILALDDVLGCRVVVFFSHQLAWIDAAIRDSVDLELSPDRPPKSFHDLDTLARLGLDPQHFDARNRKQSGYSSLHYIVRFRPARVDFEPVWFEVQVRTISEELWSEIEHHIGYKPASRTRFSVQRQFRVVSEHLQAIDMHLDFIYDELQHFQSGGVEQLTPQPSDLINAENLPTVLSDLGIRVRQSELGDVIEVLRTYNVRTVEDLYNRAPYQCLEQVRNEWRRLLPPHSEPRALLQINVIASFQDQPPKEAEIQARVRAFHALHDSLGMSFGDAELAR